MTASRDLKDEFRMLFEAAPNGAMALDADGCIIQLNAQIEKMFGYSREELIGRPVEVLVPVRFRQGHVGLRKQFAAAPQMRLLGTNLDLFGARKDGSEFAVEVGLNSMATTKGNVVVATIVDISERKRAANEENVAESVQERLQVCQQLGMPAAVLQQNGRVVHMNPLFKDFHSQFVLKDDRMEVSDPTGNEFFKQELASLDRKNHKETVYSHPVLAADGHTPLIFHILPMEGSFGSTLGLLIVTTLGAAGAPSSDVLQSLFALTPAEARVVALIGSGLSPLQAAEKLRISVKNVRTTLQHAFRKIGVSRQSELAALLTKLTFR
jgi:PAS domain S-box-containing protein